MLTELQVRHFAVVDHAEVELGAGMTVVTGETGAGKSLLVDALLLLTGARADATVVRAGCERAELVASFDLAQLPAARDWLREQALDEAGDCQLRRVIAAEGGSRAWINGRPATLAQLEELGTLLVEIHGQHEHQRLLSRATQLALLDGFGVAPELRAAVRDSARDWHALGRRIVELGAGKDPAERIDWLQHQLRELDADALAPEALAELDAEFKRLTHAEQLVQGGETLAEMLAGDSEYALAHLVHQAHSEAQRLATLDARLAPLAQLLEQAGIEIDEASDNLNRYQSDLEIDPERLAAVDAQLARLHELSRKHRVPVAELTSFAATLRQELESLQGAGVELGRLRQEQQRLATAWQQAALALGAARAKAARTLAAEVTGLMAELGMAGGRFDVALESAPGAEPDAQGRERAEFQVSANPGQPPRPLRKVASGGELSRISLAIEVAALADDAAGTMVFDEVDAGIGGAVAEVVGRKLRRLADRCQVLCVTHLPQVAAQGHVQLKVSKASQGDETRTAIEVLTGDGRRSEIARMLGGIEITAATEAHAQQMLAHGQRA